MSINEQMTTLHEVKAMRFSKAQEHLVEQKNYVFTAESKVSQAEQATEEFAQHRKLEKRRLTDEVDNSEEGVKLDQINVLNEQLAQLKQRLMAFQNKEAEARTALANAQEQLVKAQELLGEAHRDVTKINEVRTTLKSEAAIIEARKEEEMLADEYKYQRGRFGD